MRIAKNQNVNLQVEKQFDNMEQQRNRLLRRKDKLTEKWLKSQRNDCYEGMDKLTVTVKRLKSQIRIFGFAKRLDLAKHWIKRSRFKFIFASIRCIFVGIYADATIIRTATLPC